MLEASDIIAKGAAGSGWETFTSATLKRCLCFVCPRECLALLVTPQRVTHREDEADLLRVGENGCKN